MIEPKWLRDNVTEDWLRRQGVSFDYVENVSIDEVDRAISRANQARLDQRLTDGVYETLVEDYATAMRDGAAFPAPVVYRRPDGRYVIISGNHRDEAARHVGRTHVDLYVVRTQDRYIIERMTRLANNVVGRRPSDEEILNQAIALVERFNRPMTQVAAEAGIPIRRLETAVTVRRVSARLLDLGVPAAGLGSTKLVRLNQINNDPALKAAAELALRAGLTEPQVSDLSREVRDRKSEAAMLAAVDAFATRPDVQARREETSNGRVRVPAASPRNDLFAAVDRLARTLERYPTLEQAQVTSPSDIARLLLDWGALRAKMEAMIAPGRPVAGQAPNRPAGPPARAAG